MTESMHVLVRVASLAVVFRMKDFEPNGHVQVLDQQTLKMFLSYQEPGFRWFEAALPKTEDKEVACVRSADNLFLSWGHGEVETIPCGSSAERWVLERYRLIDILGRQVPLCE